MTKEEKRLRKIEKGWVGNSGDVPRIKSISNRPKTNEQFA